MKKVKDKKTFKSYVLAHKANNNKQHALFNLYETYQKEYVIHTKNYWNNFLHNEVKYKNVDSSLQKYSFSHLGSTKHITTELNSSYLQICLSTSCATLNSYLASIESKFSSIINKSSLVNEDNKDLIHQLRYINLCHAWKKKIFVYYPTINKTIVDDFGNIVTVSSKVQSVIPTSTLKLAKRIFKYVVNNRVKFPDLSKPSLILDSRVCEILNNETSKSFDYWLKISTLNKGKQVILPLQTNKYYEKALGQRGNTVALNFNFYDYTKQIYKHNKLTCRGSRSKKKSLTKVGKNFNIVLNKKSTLEETRAWKEVDANHCSSSSKSVAFDIGLCTLLANSDGRLLGKNWLEKLKIYDSKINELSQNRQKLGLKTRSKRYDGLIKQVRGFIKSESNNILNGYFLKAYNSGNYIGKVVIEKLYFNNPELSKKLNRIIKNFGLKNIKDKLNELSKIYGFDVVEINPAYSSQTCNGCGYVDEKNRTTQSLFKCLCCKKVVQADTNASLELLRRSQDKNFNYEVAGKSACLSYAKNMFIKNIPNLLVKRKISRRNLEKILSKNSYFKDFVCTT